MTHALRSIFPASAFTGDKYPDYAFHLDRLTGDPDIQTIVIIRDPRDVVSSTLVKARGVWRNSWPAEMRDAGEIARRWVNILDSTEQHRDNIHTVIYEQLVNHPQTVLSELATFIGVDGQSFDASLIHTNSIGKYRQGLSPAELDRVLAIAGERMQAFGYRLHDPARFD